MSHIQVLCNKSNVLIEADLFGDGSIYLQVGKFADDNVATEIPEETRLKLAELFAASVGKEVV